jgi:hypothetical protein
MKTFAKYWILSFVCATSGMLGCSDAEIPVLCPEAQLTALHVYDEATGEDMLNAVIVATDGVYTTHLLLNERCFGGEGLYLGVYRAGTYDVTITAEGYVPRVLGDVVREDDDNILEPIEVPMSRETQL